jgi:hypothetical protein
MIVLSDGKKEYTFYGEKETLDKCLQNDFRVCLYQGGQCNIMKLTGLFIVNRTNRMIDDVMFPGRR